MTTFDDECGVMAADIISIMGRSITLQSILRGDLNTATGTRAETTVSQTIYAAVRPDVQDPSAGSGGSSSLREQRVYDVRASDVSVTSHGSGVRWRVTDGSWVGEAVSVDRSANRSFLTITARRCA